MSSGLHQRLKPDLADPELTTGGWARWKGVQRAFWGLCARRLREHDVVGMSAALCYRTIFTIIPILILGLLVAKSLGTLEDSKRSLRRFLEASGFAQIAAVQEDTPAPPEAANTVAPPAAAASRPRETINVADEIEKLVTEVERKLTFAHIGPVGGALLIWTAVGLLAALEQSLNRIFGAARNRSVSRRLMLYWSALTLAPVTLALASYLGQKAVDLFRDVPGLPWLLLATGWAGPIVVGVLVLATLYRFLPNTTVRWRSAILGAAVATVLWLLAKWGFAIYVERLVLTGNLYGVLGVLPLFLLWLYYSWLILLFGAELAHTAVNLKEMRQLEAADRTVLGPSDVFAAAVAVAQRYETGRGPVSLAEIAARLQLPQARVQTLLDRLVAAGFVCTTDDRTARQYLPARPPGQISMLALFDLGDPRVLPNAAGNEPELAAALARVQSRLRNAIAEVSLRDACAPANADALETLSSHDPAV